MSLYNYLNSGLKNAFLKFKVSVYLWLIILATALVAFAPLSSLLSKNLGHLHLPDKPLMPFELNLMEIFLANQKFLEPYLALLLVVIFLAALIFVFLGAGLFGRMLSAETRMTFRDFLADGCRYFWKFLLSLLVFLPFLAVFFLFYRVLIAPLNSWAEAAVSEWPVIISANLRMVLFAILWTAFRLLLDVVRIIIVSESEKVIPAYVSALNFFRKYFFSLWGLYLFLGLMVVVISGAWFIITKIFSSNYFLGLLMIILLGQAYILFRLLARQVFIGVEFSFYSTKKVSK